MSRYLHFSLGPVQAFVAQARRTRDFWAGSFLLSWLVARAMKAVIEAGGRIVKPVVDDDAMKARVLASQGPGPAMGSLPNHFTAGIPDGFDGDLAARAVREAWRALADAVWAHDGLAEAGVSGSLWQDQIESFWEIQWVIAPDADGRWLAMRKNWRDRMPPASRGDKCTMMGEWQELSGIESRALKRDREQQRRFWERLRAGKGLDLADGERLCAIAWVKRRFVHAWEELEGHAGWRLPVSVPSTAYMAAAHWLAALIEARPGEEQVAHFLRHCDGEKGERATRIACVSAALEGAPAYLRELADLDGRRLFESEAAEDRAFNAARRAMIESAQSLDAPLSPFYAVLMMDGDNLGKTMQAMNDPAALSAALGRFARAMPDLVRAHNGFLVYAGGDDVLALLPLEDALPCAAAVRARYMATFRDEGVQEDAYSISAAIEYAHMKLPLTMILKDAHALLDDVAKDATGRDAVACRIWKPGGIQQTWSLPWRVALDDDDAPCIAELAGRLGQRADARREPGYAGKLLYHMRDVLEMLQGGADFDEGTLCDMLVADYLASGLLDDLEGGERRTHAEALIGPLLAQCRVYEGGRNAGRWRADGALLLRFLAQKGVER